MIEPSFAPTRACDVFAAPAHGPGELGLSGVVRPRYSPPPTIFQLAEGNHRRSQTASDVRLVAICRSLLPPTVSQGPAGSRFAKAAAPGCDIPTNATARVCWTAAHRQADSALRLAALSPRGPMRPPALPHWQQAPLGPRDSLRPAASTTKQKTAPRMQQRRRPCKQKWTERADVLPAVVRRVG